MTKHYVYSTLSCNQIYADYRKTEGGTLEITHKVNIAGGANVARDKLGTPRGIVTEVSEDDMTFLMNNHAFLTHKKNGFITVSEAKVDPECVVPDMIQADESAPVTPNDFVDDDESVAKPVSEKPSKIKERLRRMAA